MPLDIKRAVRVGQKARISLDGPAGSGKTWTSLLLASEFGERTLLIDTEHGSGALYADRFAYDLAIWEPPFDPRNLIASLDAGVQDRYDTIVIDSLSHFWSGPGGVIDIAETSNTTRSGSQNKFAGWRVATPVQNRLVDHLLSLKTHLIATMRVRTEYAQEQVNGHTEIRKLGLSPVQREGIDFEFTVAASLDLDHRLIVSKSRCAALADHVYGSNADQVVMAKTFMAWLDEAAPQPQAVLSTDGKGDIAAEAIAVRLRSQVFRNLGLLDDDTRTEVFNGVGLKPSKEPMGEWLKALSFEQVQSIARLVIPDYDGDVMPEDIPA